MQNQCRPVRLSSHMIQGDAFMPLSNVQSIVGGTLFDGRLQIWANAGIPNGPIKSYSKWKITSDPYSEWTDWNHLPEDDGMTYLAAVTFPTGQSQLIAASLGVSTELVSKYKASTDSHSEWGAWKPFLPTFPPQPTIEFSPILGQFAGAVLGPQQGPYWANTPIQLWITALNDGIIWTVLSSPAEFAETIPTACL
jgi:hypothetical protein